MSSLRTSAVIKKQQIHSSNYLETLDIVRDGLIGAALGLVAGMIGVWLLMYFKPLGPDFEIPTLVYARYWLALRHCSVPGEAA